MYSLGLRRWYRELTSEVILSTVLGQRVKVQQGEGTDLFNQLDAVLRILTRSRGHFPFFLLSGGIYATSTAPVLRQYSIVISQEQ